MNKLANTEHFNASIQQIVTLQLNRQIVKHFNELTKDLPNGNLLKYFFRILSNIIHAEAAAAMKLNSQVKPVTTHLACTVA